MKQTIKNRKNAVLINCNLKQLIYPIIFILFISAAYALTVEQLVDSYDYDYINGSINITSYVDSMEDTDANGVNDTLVFNLTAVPFVTREYNTMIMLSNGDDITTSNTSKTLSTTGLVQVNFSTYKLNGTSWNYTVRISDSNNVVVFEKYSQETSTYSSYENGTFIKDIEDQNVGNDFFNITLVLNVSKTETVNVTGFLRYNTTNNRGTITNETISAKTEVSLTADQEQNVTLMFDNETIKSTHYNGTYVLETVTIGDKSLSPDYITSSYDYEDFASTSYFKAYNHSYIDDNGNGLYEYLKLNLTMSIKQADDYTIKGSLYDLFDNQVINYSETFSLSTGEQLVVVPINGSQIYKTYIDGPYIIKYMTLKDSSGDVIDFVTEPYVTNATWYYDYELPKLPDLEMTMSVSIDTTIAETNVTVNVSNLGSAPAVGISLDLFDNTSVIEKNETITTLGINEGEAFTYTISNMNSTNITYIGIVDLLGIVDELNESNNVYAWPLSGELNQSTPILNSTFGTNLSKENLTVYNQSTTGTDVKNVINWYKGDISLLELNTPFEGGSNSTWTRDYSDNMNATVSGATYSSTAGYDGFGAYEFDGDNDWIDFEDPSIANLTANFTIVAWINPLESPSENLPRIAEKIDNINSEGYRLYYQNNSQAIVLQVEASSTRTKATPTNSVPFDVWSCIVASYNGTDINIYVNGSSSASQSFSNYSEVKPANEEQLHIGSTVNEASRFFNGTIDEFSIWNKVLTQDQASLLCDGNTDVIHSTLTSEGETWQATVTATDSDEDGTTLYSNNLTILLTPLQGIPILNTTNAKNTTVENLTVYNVSTVDGDDDPVKNIVNWWRNGSSFLLLNTPFEGGSNSTWTRDYSEHTNGTVVGATYNPTGGHDGFGAYEFDADGDYINFEDSNTANLTVNFTISVWVKPELQPDDNFPRIIDRWTGGASGKGYVIYLKNTSREVTVDLRRTGANTLTVTSIGALTFGEWSFITATYNGTDVSLYIDGVLNKTQSAGDYRHIDPKDIYTHIGAKDSGTGRFWNGSIDDVMIWGAVLTPEQIELLYNDEVNVMDSGVTKEGETWKAKVIPNDANRDGEEKYSNNLTIRIGPTQDTPILNSTYGTNLTTENLTVYNISTLDGQGNPVKNIISWSVDGSPLFLLNMPFEGGSTTTFTKDYSNTINGTVSGATWSADSGYDDFGAYTFDGVDDYILLDSTTELNLDTNYTIITHVNISSEQVDNLPRLIGRISFAQGEGYLMWYQNASNTMAFQVMAEDQKRIISSTAKVPLDEFSCYAYSYNGTDANIYINGTVKSTQSWSSYAGTNATVTEKMYLGAQSPSTRTLKGIMDDTVFVKSVLSDEQIEQWCIGGTNLILSNETAVSNVWQAEVAPNNGNADGEIKSSNSLTII